MQRGKIKSFKSPLIKDVFMNKEKKRNNKNERNLLNNLNSLSEKINKKEEKKNKQKQIYKKICNSLQNNKFFNLKTDRKDNFFNELIQKIKLEELFNYSKLFINNYERNKFNVIHGPTLNLFALEIFDKKENNLLIKNKINFFKKILKDQNQIIKVYKIFCLEDTYVLQEFISGINLKKIVGFFNFLSFKQIKKIFLNILEVF